MAEIVVAGDPALRRPCRHVAPEELAGSDLADLVVTLTAALRDAPGVGLAANQIGLGIAVAVVEDRAEYQQGIDPAILAAQERRPVELQVLVNPELEPVGGEQVEWFEGCLSLPGHTAIVPRWRAVRVRTLDAAGRLQVIEATGWHARILQHEIDHLRGAMYVDRMHSRSLMTTDAYLERWRGVPIAECKAALGIT